jgi:hypothetical protein
MSEHEPTLKDIWRLLGVMNRRFDASERQMTLLREELQGEVASLRTQMSSGFGALKQSIEARDFRLDEHGRRISALESSQRE